MAKKKSWKVPFLPQSKESIDAIIWCLENNIKVHLNPVWENNLKELFKVEILINNTSHVDPNEYEPKEAVEKMYEYYKYYYNKRNKQDGKSLLDG